MVYMGKFFLKSNLETHIKKNKDVKNIETVDPTLETSY